MPGKAIYDILSNDAPVTALVSNRIYPVLIGQTIAMPAIAYSEIYREPSDTKDGVSTLDAVRVQIDCYAETYAETRTISEAVRTALDRVTPGTYGTIDVDGIRMESTSGVDMFEDETERFHHAMDFQIRIKR